MAELDDMIEAGSTASANLDAATSEAAARMLAKMLVGKPVNVSKKENRELHEQLLKVKEICAFLFDHRDRITKAFIWVWRTQYFSPSLNTNSCCANKSTLKLIKK